MNEVCGCEKPLIIISGIEGKCLGSEYGPFVKDRVTMEIIGHGYVGLINSVSPLDESKKIFCYSYSGASHLNIITAYMGYEFNGKVFVKKEGLDEEDLNYKFMHKSEFLDGIKFKNIDLKNGLLRHVTCELLQIHKENTKRYELERLNLTKIAEMYHHLICSSGKAI